jgi:hypothetical protein
MMTSAVRRKCLTMASVAAAVSRAIVASNPWPGSRLTVNVSGPGRETRDDLQPTEPTVNTTGHT